MSALPRLHVTTNDEVLADDSFVARALAVVEAGRADIALHVRGRGVPAARLHAIATALQPTCTRLGARLLVNSRVDVAMTSGADGVQLGVRALPVADARSLLGDQRLIGYSAHSAEEAAGAVEAGANFVVFGSVWETPSHPDIAPAGPDALRSTVEEAGAPVVAIGGVTPARVEETARAGAHGVAVLSGVWRAGEAAEAVAMYLDALRAAYAGRRGKEEA